MRGVTQPPFEARETLLISTHTPHARRDDGGDMPKSEPAISTHTPHARRDQVRTVFFPA